MASRSSSGTRSRARSSSSSSSAQTIVLVVGAIAVVGLLLVMSGGGGNKPAASGSGTSTPAAAPAASPTTVVSVPAGSAKAGKSPDRPAPALTQDTLGKLAQLQAQATELFNESVNLRNGGDNMKAREAAGRAKDVLDQWNQLVEPNLLWQEEAQLGEWSQPAEYIQLEKLFGAYQTLNNKVRKQGG